MARPRPDWVPPMREGVSASRVAVGAGPWRTLADFLQARMPAGGDWAARLAAGEVLDHHGHPVPPTAPAVAGQLLWYWRRPPPEPPVPFSVELLHHDDRLVVVDKPHFLAVAPSGRHLHETVLVRLKRQLGIETLVPMHRLDRETAGVLAFIVQPAHRNAYQAIFRERRARKVYDAVAPWRDGLALPLTCHHRLEDGPGDHFMQMQVVAGEPNAVTEVALLRRLPGGLAHYRLTPITGRRHQLRAQMNALGLPLVGDRIYPRLWPEPAPGAAPDHANPLQLLARELAFVDPVDGQARRFVSRRQLALADSGEAFEAEGDGGAAEASHTAGAPCPCR